MIEHQLVESVKASLRNELYPNAAFLCERLYAEVKNEEVKLLLAECYLGKKNSLAFQVLNYFAKIGEGKAYKAYEILKDSQQNPNRYKLAITCIKLNKLQEAERVLLNKKNQK